jgi:Ca-activated chloride channel homolog
MWASQEKSDLFADIASRYEKTSPSEDLRCVRIEVVRKASGEAEDELKQAGVTGGTGLPQVWSPAASTWLRLLERDRAILGASAIIPSAAPPVMQSPLVIAMAEPMARALGWPAADIAWKDIFALARDTQSWASRGHPDWGRFKFAKTNPQVSTSGLHTLLSTYLISGGPSTADPKTFNYMKDVEASVEHYSSTVSSFLGNLWQEDDRGTSLTYVSAIAMEEQQIWNYNRGNPEFKRIPLHLPPRIRLVAIYPSEGTFMADHPYVVMPWASEPQQRAAQKFLDYLKSDAIQRELMDNAFRGARGETGGPINDDNAFSRVIRSNLFPMPNPTLLEQIQSSWSTYRKRARVLVIVDSSASMGERVASASKLDLAKSAWTAGIEGFVDEDEVGLWTLEGADRRRAVDIGPLKDVRAQLRAALSSLAPRGSGKGLYAAITDGIAAVRQRASRDRINAVVVLTDGRNDDPSNSDLNGLLRSLLAQTDDERVRVFTVALGAAADKDSLERIARAARGTFFGEATDPQVINRVIADVVSSF